jgi:hypothetical protein
LCAGYCSRSASAAQASTPTTASVTSVCCQEDPRQRVSSVGLTALRKKVSVRASTAFQITGHCVKRRAHRIDDRACERQGIPERVRYVAALAHTIPACVSAAATRAKEPFDGTDAPSTVMRTLASRLAVCRLLLGVLVSMQRALAAFACPAGLSERELQAGSLRADRVSTDRGATDAALGSLCSAHHEQGQQSADRTPIPVLAGPLGGVWLQLKPVDDTQLGTVTADASVRPIAAGPPHANLHCCLRS